MRVLGLGEATLNLVIAQGWLTVDDDGLFDPTEVAALRDDPTFADRLAAEELVGGGTAAARLGVSRDALERFVSSGLLRVRGSEGQPALRRFRAGDIDDLAEVLDRHHSADTIAVEVEEDGDAQLRAMADNLGGDLVESPEMYVVERYADSHDPIWVERFARAALWAHSTVELIHAEWVAAAASSDRSHVAEAHALIERRDACARVLPAGFSVWLLHGSRPGSTSGRAQLARAVLPVFSPEEHFARFERCCRELAAVDLPPVLSRAEAAERIGVPVADVPPLLGDFLVYDEYAIRDAERFNPELFASARQTSALRESFDEIMAGLAGELVDVTEIDPDATYNAEEAARYLGVDVAVLASRRSAWGGSELVDLIRHPPAWLPGS